MYAVRLHNSSMSMMVTRSEARCRACSVAVPKSDQRRNPANPASQHVAPTFVNSCILKLWTVAFPTNDSFICFRSLEKLRHLCFTFDHGGVANPLSCDSCHLIGSVHIPAEYTETWRIGPDIFFSPRPTKKNIRLARETNGCLTCIVATFVESLQRLGKYHWSGEVLL